MKLPTVLSAFTGAGGLDLGLECAGFNVVACVEFDETARKTLSLNRNWKYLEPHDINELVADIEPVHLGLRPLELDVLAGGPPCQPFSKAAQWTDSGMRGLEDPRSDCLKSFLNLAEKFLPKAILIENVPGFANGKNSAVSLIESTLNRINKTYSTKYHLQWRILDAVDYGIPQRRQRAVIIALRDGSLFRWPKATHRGRPVRAYDALAGVNLETIPAAKGKWAKLLPSIPEGQNYLWHTPGGGGRPLFGYRTKYWSFLLKLAKAEPAWTLSASPGPSTGPFHWDNRPLGVEELLRLQSFPASWRVSGDYRSQIRQIGNATPPLLGEILGRELGKQIFNIVWAEPLTLAIRRKSKIPAANAIGKVPPEYKHLEGPHSPHPGTGKGPRPRTKKAASPSLPLFPTASGVDTEEQYFP